jgi:phosphate acetyltransferase
MQNITFEELIIGQSAQLQREVKQKDIEAFAAISGDTNPAHLNPAFAQQTPFHGVVAHGMWEGSLISALLGTQLPGPGTIYLQQNLTFKRPARIGDQLTAKVTVKSKDAAKHRVWLDCTITNHQDQLLVSGEALVIAPTQKLSV